MEKPIYAEVVAITELPGLSQTSSRFPSRSQLVANCCPYHRSCCKTARLHSHHLIWVLVKCIKIIYSHLISCHCLQAIHPQFKMHEIVIMNSEHRLSLAEKSRGGYWCRMPRVMRVTVETEYV